MVTSKTLFDVWVVFMVIGAVAVLCGIAFMRGDPRANKSGERAAT